MGPRDLSQTFTFSKKNLREIEIRPEVATADSPKKFIPFSTTTFCTWEQA